MRRRRRGLSYLPPEPTRTPFFVYLLVAALSFAAIFYFKGQIVKTVSGKVVDAYNGKPVVGATVLIENDTALSRTAGISRTVNILTDIDGSFNVDKATERFDLSINHPNYRPYKLDDSLNLNIEVKLQPKYLRGTVRDTQGKFIGRASVTVGDKNVLTDSEGGYVLDDAPAEGQVVVKSAGYRPMTQSFSRTTVVDITLQPLVTRGIYLRAQAVSDPAFFPNILNLLTSTELNAVVIDLKDSNGQTFYDSKQPLARAAPASKGKIPDLPQAVKTLKEKEIYTIARISVFQDASLTDVKPEVALKSKNTGRLWADSARYNWANPYNKEVWDYNIALAKEAVAAGFDEIQFAYVHFPSTGNLTDIDYGQVSNTDTRVQNIVGYLKEANTQLNQLGVFVSVEVMGQSVLESGDLGIGQDIGLMADYVDYITPVLFPSYFGQNSFGHAKPGTQPYDVVNKGLTFARSKLQNKRAQLRPWLQDFSADGVTYGPVEVRAEIQAVEDYAKNLKDTPSWLLWNVEGRYTLGALKKKT
jgi:hypothetical protein